MAYFVATAAYDSVRLWEETDVIQGGRVGDSVAVKSVEPDNLPLQQIVNNLEAMKIGRISGARNSVLNGARTAGGDPSFGTFSTRILTIAGNVTPLVLNFAQGASAFGMKETVVSYTGSATIDYTASINGQQYLVFALLTGSTLSFVSIEVAADMPWHVQPLAPTLFGDQFYFNTSDQKVYREVTGAFVERNAILIGSVRIPGSGGEFKMKPYGTPAFSFDAPCGSIYKWHAGAAAPSGWSLCAGASLYVAHNIELYNIIGFTYGGSGLTFDLPTITDSIIKLY